MMEYATVSARFKFFNGKQVFTVERLFALSKWYIFQGEETSNAVYVSEEKQMVFSKVNANTAEDVLLEYLETF